MNENKTYEAGAQGLPGITVKIHMLRDAGRDHGKLAGFASVNLGGVFAVNSIRIYNTERGLYVAMPSKKGPDESAEWRSILIFRKEYAYVVCNTGDFRKRRSNIEYDKKIWGAEICKGVFFSKV